MMCNELRDSEKFKTPFSILTSTTVLTVLSFFFLPSRSRCPSDGNGNRVLPGLASQVVYHHIVLAAVHLGSVQGKCEAPLGSSSQ